jgi:hypothetical protein
MTFPLVKTIYDNLGFLEKNAYLTRFDSCANSVREYLAYRIPGVQFNKFMHLTNVEKRELCPRGQIASLVQHIKDNKQDGLYWVLFNDLNTDHEEPEVFQHTFILEKQGENFCLIQTYQGIGNRSVFGISVQSKGEDIISRLENIARLVDGDFVIWNEDDWYIYSKNLNLPDVKILREYEVVYNPQVAWKFIPLTSQGCLHTMYQKAKENNHCDLVKYIEDLSQDKDYIEYNHLQPLVESINAEVEDA